jgi:hypothetical protein
MSAYARQGRHGADSASASFALAAQSAFLAARSVAKEMSGSRSARIAT